MAMVIVAGLCFLAAGVFGLILWWGRRKDKRAELSEIQQQVEEIKARHTPEDHVSGKLSVQQIQDKVQREQENDPAHTSPVARASYGKHALRSEDDYPTARIPVYGDPEQTEPISALARPYLDA